MAIKRAIQSKMMQHISSGNDVIVVYGARQVGKTTLINQTIDQLGLKNLTINAEELNVQSIFSKRDLKLMLEFTEGYDLLFIDEAQNIENIGINIKILHDANPNLKIILSGSSSFDLSNSVKEPLTGRTKTFILYPISIGELRNEYNSYETKQLLSDLLITGSYPNLFNLKTKKERVSHLGELASSYLYKDILSFSNIKHSDKLYNLLRLLAFQIGHTVSINELSNSLKISHETVNHYIELLEKSFVIFRLSGYSRNLRKEVSKQDKIFFYDVGIRNSIINNFSKLEDRTDVGQLWENFLIIERKKVLSYNELHRGQFFWRTYTGAELDYVEEYDGKLDGFEFKWTKRKVRKPKTFLESYENSTFKIIHKDNFLTFLT